MTSRSSQGGLPYPYSEPERCRERWGTHSKGGMTIRDHTTHALLVVSPKTPAPLFPSPLSFFSHNSVRFCSSSLFDLLPTAVHRRLFLSISLSVPLVFSNLLLSTITYISFWVLVLLSHPSQCPPSSTPNSTTTTTTTINHNTTLITGCPQITTTGALVGARKLVSRTLNVNFGV